MATSAVSKRAKPQVTVNTSLHIKPQLSRRSTSASSLSSSTKSTEHSWSRCTSPTSTSSPCSSSLRSPSPSSHRSPNGATSPPPPPLPSPISVELYFRLLKKADVVDHLLEVSTYVECQHQQLKSLEVACAKNESVQALALSQLETHKRQFVEAQKFMLELVEAMTEITIKEELMQKGESSREATATAEQTKEQRVVTELQDAMRNLSGDRRNPFNADSVESSALRAVGIARVRQLRQICEAYEAQLVNSEEELSRATHAAFKDECLARIRYYEEKQRHHDDEIKELAARIENLQGQKRELNDVIDDQRDEIAQLKQANQALRQGLERQTSNIETFGSDLKGELRKRFGVVPSVLDSRWRQYFPECSVPQ